MTNNNSRALSKNSANTAELALLKIFAFSIPIKNFDNIKIMSFFKHALQANIIFIYLSKVKFSFSILFCKRQILHINMLCSSIDRIFNYKYAQKTAQICAKEEHKEYVCYSY